MKNNDEFAPLSLSMDPEMRTQSNNILDGYTINREGIIKDPEGNILTPRGYRGRPVVGICGYMVFIDYAVAKIFNGGHRIGMYIEHIDGDLTNCHADNLRWKPRSPHQHIKHQPKQEAPKEEKKRPEGWIKRFTMDGILIREYADVDQLVYELLHFGEVDENNANNVPSVIRRTHKFPERYRHYLGSKWKVSDPSVLDSKRFGIHPERYNGQPPTLMEYTPASETWIKRYVGPWLVQTFVNIDEAVEYVSQAFSVRQQQTRQRLRSYMQGEGRDATIYGSRWEASGPEALKSVHTEDYGGRPAVEEVKTSKEEVKEPADNNTLNQIEPIKEEEVKPTPQPIEEVKKRKPATSQRPKTTKQTSDRPDVEVIVEGDVESVKVTMEDNRIRIVLRAR